MENLKEMEDWFVKRTNRHIEADFCAMAKEKGGKPKDWADKNVNIRWKFNDSQKDLIYSLMEMIWS